MNWKGADHHAERLRGRRVLVVEDEPLIALELRSLLTDEGAVVVGPGRNLDESAGLARKGRLSAALLDVRLGRDTVSPIAKILHERGVPFAFYTGQTEFDAMRREWPAAPVIAKPSPARAVMKVIERLCGA